MQVKILWYIIIFCLCSGVVDGQELPGDPQAQEYHKLGLFYNALFNTAVNTQLNYYNAKLYLAGRGELPRGIKRERKDHIWYYRGLCYYYQGGLKKAIADFKRVPESSDKYFEAMIKSGACYYKQREIKKAKGLWDKVYSKKKDNPQFLSKLGNLYAELGINMDTAFEYCQKKKIGKRGLVWIYLEKGKIDKALSLIREIDAKEPDLIDGRGEGVFSRFYDPGILKLKSLVHLRAAEKYYQMAIKKKRNDSLCYQLGIAQLMGRRIGDSIRTLTPLTGSSKWEIKAEAKINLGVAYYLEGTRTTANTLWNEVRQKYNNRPGPGVMSELGYIYSRLGINLNNALSLCKEEDKLFSYYSGMACFKKGLLENNMDYISKAPALLEKSPCDPVYLLDLSNAYYIRRDFWHATNILMQIDSPDVKMVFDNVQGMAYAWESIALDAQKQNWKIEWIDLWY
ncbi:MAG: hypothetical protein ABH870_04605 [bacterium]